MLECVFATMIFVTLIFVSFAAVQFAFYIFYIDAHTRQALQVSDEKRILEEDKPVAFQFKIVFFNRFWPRCKHKPPYIQDNTPYGGRTPPVDA